MMPMIPLCRSTKVWCSLWSQVFTFLKKSSVSALKICFLWDRTANSSCSAMGCRVPPTKLRKLWRSKDKTCGPQAPPPAACKDKLLNRHGQRVVVLADETTQIRADLAGSFKSSGLRGGFLIFRQSISAFRVVFQVAKHADGKDVPRCSLIAHKDKILRLLQS